jgi:hypothetical protein
MSKFLDRKSHLSVLNRNSERIHPAPDLIGKLPVLLLPQLLPGYDQQFR